MAPEMCMLVLALQLEQKPPAGVHLSAPSQEVNDQVAATAVTSEASFRGSGSGPAEVSVPSFHPHVSVLASENRVFFLQCPFLSLFEAFMLLATVLKGAIHTWCHAVPCCTTKTPLRCTPRDREEKYFAQRTSYTGDAKQLCYKLLNEPLIVGRV